MISPRISRLILVCLALLCITAVSASAQQRIYTTAASDGTVWWQYDQNWGQRYEGGYSTGNWGTAYYNNGSGEFEAALLQFPISSLAGTTLAPNSARLHIYCYSSEETVAPTMGLDPYVNASGTINGYVSVSPANEVFVDVSHTPAWREMDVTPYLQWAIDRGRAWAGYGFNMECNVNQYGSYPGTAYVATYENTDYRPYLEITPVPEPSSLMALMAGIAGMGGVLVRRSR